MLTHGLEPLDQIVANSFGTIDNLYKNGREVTGLATDFTKFDAMTSGLQKGDLIIIAARPSMGKTALAINIAQNAAVNHGATVAVFSLEMSKASLLRRMLASQAWVDQRSLQNGIHSARRPRTLQSALGQLVESRIFIDDSAGISLAEMRAKARRLKQNAGGLDLVVVDYLQLMSATVPSSGRRNYENRTQEVSAISRGLKALAKELDVPVVALSQLSRASERRGDDKRPMLSDLRESGSIEQDADVVAFIHRESYYNHDKGELSEADRAKSEIIIAKQRNGPTDTVHLNLIERLTRFENQDTGHDVLSYRSRSGSELVDDERDAAGQQVARGIAGINLDQIHGEGWIVGAQDEATQEKIHVTKGEVRAVPHCVEVGMVRTVGRERVVMAVDEHDGLRQHQRLHCQSIGRGNARPQQIAARRVESLRRAYADSRGRRRANAAWNEPTRRG